MKNCVYFAKNQKIPEEGFSLARGYGFTAEGLWRCRPINSNKYGLIIDDLCLPSRAGIAAACRALAEWRGLIVLDFERPRVGALAELARSLTGRRVVLPPPYADLSHEAVLVGPWQGECRFSNWLTLQRKRYGAVVFDAAPLRVQCFPGGCRRAWTGTLPAKGFPCAGLGCLYRRLSDGSILFWDTRQTLSARLSSAGVPVIMFRADWAALRDEYSDP